MQPIHELLARIRYDPEFGRGEFEVGYLDRVDATVHRVALREISFPEGQRRVFEIVDETGQFRRIAKAVQVLGTPSILEAATAHARHQHPHLELKSVAEVVEELLTAKAEKGRSQLYRRDLRVRWT